MTDEWLENILKSTDIDECQPIVEDYIYYLKKTIKSRVSREGGRYGYSTNEYEFLIIAEEKEKQGIIMRCRTEDLHWLVLRPWRNCHILSNALRTGVVHQVWPENKTITCRYSWRDKMRDRPQKYNMTKHLATIAGLELIEG